MLYGHRLLSLLLAGTVAVIVSAAHAEQNYNNKSYDNQSYDNQRTQVDYMLSCQGCHGPKGHSRNENVPSLTEHVGVFLQTQKGREYLVRVPGSATSSLSDASLADVLNWIVVEFSGSTKPDNFEPYTTAEVTKLRQSPLLELVEYRKKLLREIAEQNSVRLNNKRITD